MGIFILFISAYLFVDGRVTSLVLPRNNNILKDNVVSSSLIEYISKPSFFRMIQSLVNFFFSLSKATYTTIQRVFRHIYVLPSVATLFKETCLDIFHQIQSIFTTMSSLAFFNQTSNTIKYSLIVSGSWLLSIITSLRKQTWTLYLKLYS